MDIRFLIVGAPFLIAFFYTLFWLKKWGAFNSTNNSLPKNISLPSACITIAFADTFVAIIAGLVIFPIVF